MTILQSSIVPSSGYLISRSLRFNSPDSAYLNRTPASASNRKTWTWSGWVKRSGLSANNMIFMGRSDGTNYDQIRWNSDNTLYFFGQSGGVDSYRRATTQVFRDVGGWYHIVAVLDTPNATAANRVKLYINGVEVTAFSTSTNPTQNFDSYVNNTNVHLIGGNNIDVMYSDQYMTEVNFIDGQALTPSSFGQTNPSTGVWQPIKYTGTYGTNGFYLNFSDNSNTTATTLGKDYSGNGNNWTPNNFSVAAGSGNDSLVDTPTPYGSDTGAGGEVRGNYATLSPLTPNHSTLVNGNLQTTGGDKYSISTIGMSSGKWYAEMTVVTAGTETSCGIANGNPGSLTFVGQNDGVSWGYYFSNGNKYFNGSGSAYGSAYTDGDVIGIAFDADAGSLYFYKNGTVQNSGTAAFTGLTNGPYYFAMSGRTAGTPNNCYINFGQRPFAYTAPSGYKALCTQNLPTPTIGATATTTANKYFDATLYTGTSASQSVTNAGAFQPDLVWVKSRSAATDHKLTDAVRGVTKALISDTTGAETTDTNGLTAFNSNGFTVGSDSNYNNGTGPATYVGWQWNAGGSNATNTAGSITSTVRANTTAGFSIVTWVMPNSGTSGTVGHGLGVAPRMIIIKNRSAANNWNAYHASLGADKYLFLNTTAASATDTTRWNNTSPTSTVFSLGGAFIPDATTPNFVAYCFAEIAGYSAFGSYTGNASTDGPFVYTGFRPKYLMIKCSSAAGYYWVVVDSVRNTYNLTTLKLDPNESAAENAGGSGNATNNTLDILSNGFKLRTADGDTNIAQTYIYAAFCESPFKFSLAR